MLTRAATLLAEVDKRIRGLITLAYAVCADESPLRVGPKCAADQFDERGTDVDVAQPGAWGGHEQRRSARAWMCRPAVALIAAQRRDRARVQRDKFRAGMIWAWREKPKRSMWAPPAGLPDPHLLLAHGVGRLDRPADRVPLDDLFGGGGRVEGEQGQVVGVGRAELAEQHAPAGPVAETAVPDARPLGQLHGLGAPVPVHRGLPPARAGGRAGGRGGQRGGPAELAALQRRAPAAAGPRRRGGEQAGIGR